MCVGQKTNSGGDSVASIDNKAASETNSELSQQRMKNGKPMEEERDGDEANQNGAGVGGGGEGEGRGGEGVIINPREIPSLRPPVRG